MIRGVLVDPALGDETHLRVVAAPGVGAVEDGIGILAVIVHLECRSAPCHRDRAIERQPESDVAGAFVVGRWVCPEGRQRK